MKIISFQKNSTGSVGLVILVIILSVVILGGVVGGAWYYTKSQNSNNKSQTNPKSQNSNTASVIPTEAEESLTDETGADTTTHDPTADWKTYENTKYGYTIKYPKEWYAIDKLIGGISFFEYLSIDSTFYEMKEAGYQPGKVFVKIYPKISGSNYTIKKVIETYSSGDNYSTSVITINGIVMNKITCQLSDSGPGGMKGTQIIRFIFNDNDNNIYELGYEGNPSENIIQYDQILSTFKFTQ